MIFRSKTLLATGAVWIFYSAGLTMPATALAQAQDYDDYNSAVPEGVEVLTRGPVHEAFAETIVYNPRPGIFVNQAPPEPIEELPPEQRPEGNNTTWIPGYWAWDDERGDFLWISGVWRNLPPGREWIPGYWDAVGSRWQWVSGYWGDAAQEDVEYLPEPPASVETGPNTEAPSAEDSWRPGSWVWRENRYAWRPGLWQRAEQNRVWVPAHYVRTGRGYVFVEGYHDYSMERRGVLFAPVHVRREVYARPGFSWSPSMVIGLAGLGSRLFVRPSHDHYYYGDYYSPKYKQQGYHSSISYSGSREGYDPIFTQERWRHRDDRDWDRRTQEEFNHRRDHEDARPPATWSAWREQGLRRGNDRNDRDDRGGSLLSTFKRFTSSGNSGSGRFMQVNEDERRSLAGRGRALQEWRKERQKLEKDTDDRRDGKDRDKDKDKDKNAKPSRLKLPKSLFISQEKSRDDRNDSERGRGQDSKNKPDDKRDDGPKNRPDFKPQDNSKDRRDDRPDNEAKKQQDSKRDSDSKNDRSKDKPDDHRDKDRDKDKNKDSKDRSNDQRNKPSNDKPDDRSGGRKEDNSRDGNKDKDKDRNNNNDRDKSKPDSNRKADDKPKDARPSSGSNSDSRKESKKDSKGDDDDRKKNKK